MLSPTPYPEDSDLCGNFCRLCAKMFSFLNLGPWIMYVTLSLVMLGFHSCVVNSLYGGVCDVIVLIIISAHAPGESRALFRVEHVVSTVTIIMKLCKNSAWCFWIVIIKNHYIFLQHTHHSNILISKH